MAQDARFVGRTSELGALAEELALVRGSGMRGVVLRGEPGIGKTTLLAAFAQSVVSTADATVVYGRCDETGVPLQPFRSVLADCVEHAPVDLLAEHVAWCSGELMRICPQLAMRVETAPDPTVSDDATERFLVFEAATDLLRRIATPRPLVLMFDDLQWAEPTALLMLRHITHALADAPVLIVASSREFGEHASEQLRAALADLERGEHRGLQLAGFDDDELADLVAIAAPVTGDIEARPLLPRCVSRPPAIRSTHRSSFGIGSSRAGSRRASRHPTGRTRVRKTYRQAWRDVVWSRVNALGADASRHPDRGVGTRNRVFRRRARRHGRAPGVGRGRNARCRNAGRPPGRRRVGAPNDTIRARARRQCVVRRPGAVASSALARASGPRPRTAHRRHRARRRGPARAPLRSRGWPGAAQRWSTLAGDQAFEQLAPTEASHHYRVALDIAIAMHRPDAERADLLVRLGEAQLRAGDPQAQDTIAEAADLARRSGAGDSLIRAAFASNLGIMRLDPRAAEYLATVEAAVAVADRADTATYARLLALLAQTLVSTPDVERRVASANQALELADAHPDPTLLARIAPGVLWGLWEPGSADVRSRVATRAVAAAEHPATRGSNSAPISWLSTSRSNRPIT